MPKIIKRPGTKRRKEQLKIYYNELVDVEGVGKLRVKIDSETGTRFQTHLDALRVHRGIPSLTPDNYEREIGSNDKIVTFFYQVLTELEEMQHIEALREAKFKALQYYNDAESAATVSAMMITLVDDNFEIEAEGIRRSVNLKPPLNQVEIDEELFNDGKENNSRSLSMLPPRTPRKKYVPEEQMIAILTMLTEIDANFSSALAGKMTDAFNMLQEGKLTTSDEEVDEAGFQPRNLDTDLHSANESASMEV